MINSIRVKQDKTENNWIIELAEDSGGHDYRFKVTNGAMGGLMSRAAENTKGVEKELFKVRQEREAVIDILCERMGMTRSGVTQVVQSKLEDRDGKGIGETRLSR